MSSRTTQVHKGNGSFREKHVTVIKDSNGNTTRKAGLTSKESQKNAKRAADKKR